VKQINKSSKKFTPVAFLLITAMSSYAATERSVVALDSTLPLAFEENRGQAPAGVSYISRSRSGTVLLGPGSIGLKLGEDKTIAMHFVGATARNAPAGEQKLPGVTSYFIGDESNWVRGIPNYATVRYASIYPGIDAVFHGNQKLLEYDFVLSPEANPDQIRVGFEDVDHLAIDSQGNLELLTAQGKITQRRPKIWQTGPRGRREVMGRYVLVGPAEVRFQIDPYDRHNALVIDPVIDYSTYFGSSSDDRVQTIATDSTGAAYIAGSTVSAGITWGFVSKINPGGTAVVYTTYLGSGVCNAAARGIAVDTGNNAIVTGYYTQTDVSGACTLKRIYGAKIDPTGASAVYQLVWGGSQDYGNAVTVDGSGNAYFTGSTQGNLPTTAGVISPSGGSGGDAFITKLAPAGALIYSTYLGGSLTDEGLAITVDSSGNAYVAGSTSSSNYPTTANAVQATIPNPSITGFVTEVNAAATQVLYSTFLGGNTGEGIYGVAIDGQGKINVAGITNSSTFPTTANAWDRTCGTDGACNSYNNGTWHYLEDAFYSRIDPLKAGTTGLLYSTFLGGANRDLGEAIAIDKNGRAWITGRTASTDFPTVQATQATLSGGYDSFIFQIDPTQSGAASVLFSTFLGGALYEEGTGINADPLGNIYVVGYTGSTNLPVASALQPQSAGGNDGFVIKLSVPSAPALASVGISPTAVLAGMSATGTVTMSSAPGSGSVTVALSSNSGAASVPTTVLVPAGQTHATFSISTSSVASATTATITATYNGATKTSSLLVNPPLASITLNPGTVMGGAGSTGTVTLGSAAPATGAVVTLASSNAATATVPASVTVPAGATSANFAITTNAVTAATTVSITATYSGVSKMVNLVVNSPLASITLSPSVLAGGAGSTGTVTLSAAAPAGGAVVTLTSSNTTAATVPASVTVAAGATSANFAITTNAVTASTSVNITATYSGASKVVTLTLNPTLASVSLNPGTVTGGAGSTGTVTLGTAAPAGGAVVALTSNNAAATVPASLTVAAGATSANFAITTNAVTASTSVNITATYSGANRAVTLVVNPALASVTLSPGTVTGGAGSTGTVTLGTAAPAGGAVVALTSNNAVATVPASLTVAAGATSANFAITTNAVTASTSVNITATYSGANRAVTLVVNPALASVTLNPGTVTGGTSSTGTVTLGMAAPAGGAAVALASNNAAATVPASVTVAAGATTANFAITTTAVTTATTVGITATYSGASKTANLAVNPPLASITLSPAVVTGGAGSTATVTLSAAAPAGGAVVTLTSSNTTAATVPASVTVAVGATTANFAITTTAVATSTSVNITATYSGASKVVTLVVNPPLASITLSPGTVTGGSGSTGTVTLSAAAPASGAVVALTSNNAAATVPASVTVAAGATTANFAITTTAVTTATAVTLTANYSGVAKTTTLTVNPSAVVAGVTLAPATVTGGSGSTGTVTLSAAAPAGGAVVALTSNNAAATVPASVTVAAGATTANFAITTTAVTTATAVTLTASCSGVTKTTTLTVNPPAALATLSFAPPVVIFGANSTGTVTLTSPAPAGGAVIALAAADWFVFSLPASVTVPAGATTATFTITSELFSTTTTITASYNGVNKTANITSIDPSVVAMTCNPNPVIAGNTTICTVTMNGVMPFATTVYVLSDQPFFAPASGTVTVPAGNSKTNFSTGTTLVPAQIIAHISANALGTATVTTPLTINLTNRGRTWVLNNVVFKDGGTASGYFTYDPATGAYLDANIQVTPGADPSNPLGQAPQNLYYYPWPNGFNPTFVDNWSTPSLLSLQNPVSTSPNPPVWTLLQLNFAQALTNAGGTIPLVTNPTVAYTPFCVDNLPGICTPPPGNISQELFAMPPAPPPSTPASGYYFRVIVSGTVTAQ
jgi:hypothetical protein